MIIQLDKETGAVLSLDYVNTLEDVERNSPSYIEVVEVTQEYLNGMTKSALQKMAGKGRIEYPEGATKADIVKTILGHTPEVEE